MMTSILKKYNPNFEMNGENWEEKNILTSMKNQWTVIAFHWLTAALSYRYDSFNAQFNDYLSYFPNAKVYYHQAYGDVLSEDTMRTFFRWLIDLKLRPPDCDSDTELLDNLNINCSINCTVMKRLLYFSLTSAQVELSDLSSKCFDRPTMLSGSRVFQATNIIRKENEFKCLFGEAHTMFHGTHEQNVYSILRNGIQPNKFSGVAMTPSINTALAYTDDPYRVVLIYEAKQVVQHKVQAEEDGYSMPPRKVILRGVVWLKRCDPTTARQMVKKAVGVLDLGFNSVK